MILPKRLSSNSKIGIFCSSSPITNVKYATALKDFFSKRGYEIVIHPQAFKVFGHTAGSIKERVDAIHHLINNPDIGMLMAFWGGANTNQILPHLNYNLIKNNPKIIVGFSDTSALTLAITKETRLVTYMGPAGISFTKPSFFEYTWEYFNKTFINPNDHIIVNDSYKYADDAYYLRNDDKRIIKKNERRKVYKNGFARGEIIAANLQTLLVLQGTKFAPDLRNKILFLEEAEEEDTKMIHRYFTHLAQSADLNKVKAILIGRFCQDSGFNTKDKAEDVFEDVFANIDIPIIYNLDFGHSDPLFTIPNGGTAIVDTHKDQIIFEKSVL